MAFKTGDLVSLKSGGAVMTVEEIADDKVLCVWFDGKKLLRGDFYPDTLTEKPAPLAD